MVGALRLLGFAIEPLFWVLLGLLASLLLARRRPRTGRALGWLALFGLVAACWTSGPEVLLSTLESRYRAPQAVDMHRYAGVVVLGGALADPALWAEHGQVGLNTQAERMTEAVALIRRHPQLRLVFTGGLASGSGATEAARARVLFEALGVEPSRMTFEDRSRNTYENAVFTAQLARVDKRQPWLLLTSAFHMPRAMGVFEHAGWNVTPWPTDYRTSAHDSWFDFSLSGGPALWSLALHEWLGMAAYRLLGWM